MTKQRKLILTVALVCSMALAQMAFVCTAQSVITQVLTWLPTIEQAIVAVLQGVSVLKGSTITTVDAAKIDSYGASAKVTLTDLTNAINAYKTSPDPTTLARINAAYQSLSQAQVDLLPALHIVDPSTQAKVSAGIGLVGVAISTVGALISELQPPPVSAGAKPAAAVPVMTVGQFKQRWNQTMKADVENPSVKAAFAHATLQ